MQNVIVLSAIVMLVLLFLKVPVYVSVLGGSLVYFAANPSVNSIVFAQQAIGGVEKVSLLAIPFFVCAGIFMNYTGVTSRIMDFCEVVTGRMRGGLAQVNILLSTLMGGLSGSNIADAAMEAKMLVPEMVKKGFSLEFSTVITATSSMITPLIPPGIAMILYACIANVSVGKLFMSGIGVGIVLCASLMIMTSVISKKRGYKRMREEKATPKQIWGATKPAILPLCLPIIIIGVTDSHDHLIRSGGPEVSLDPAFLMDDLEAAKREFAAFLKAGGRTMVCMDPIGCGPDPKGDRLPHLPPHGPRHHVPGDSGHPGGERGLPGAHGFVPRPAEPGPLLLQDPAGPGRGPLLRRAQQALLPPGHGDCGEHPLAGGAGL